MKRKEIYSLILGLLLAYPALSQKITYIVNVGVIVEEHKSKILVDGVLDYYNPKFPAPSQTTQDAIVNGHGIYKGIDKLIISHSHAKSPKPELAYKFLSAHPSAGLITTPQMATNIKNSVSAFSSVEKRIIVVPPHKSWKFYKEDTLAIKCARTYHAGKTYSKTDHFITLIEGSSRSIVHVAGSDADVSRFAYIQLEKEEVDIAFVPFWHMTNLYGSEFVKNYIPAKKYVAIHLPPGSSEIVKKIKKFFPSAITSSTTERKIYL